MNHVTAACGCTVAAVGAPGSPARDRAELEPCACCSALAAYERFRDNRQWFPDPEAVQACFDRGDYETAGRVVHEWLDHLSCTEGFQVDKR